MFDRLYANCLLVNDFEKSLKFYRDILKLEINTREGQFADFKLKGTSLAIFGKDEAESMFSGKYMGKGGGIVLGFQVDDVSEACNELMQKGVEIFEGPKTTSWGQTVAYFYDPDNNIWEISNN